MDYPCYGCWRQAEDDARPWLLITGWRGYRTPTAVLLCPDCENDHASLADDLNDLSGVRLSENSAANIRRALRGWPVEPQKARFR
ncbi:hypothetical protein A5657_15555 [Mycobacterium kubicae]|nr:hypothetical protein A5657_15555 [Mycobacterium kubicae]